MTIVRINRIFYVVGEEVGTSDGELEIVFSDNREARLRGGGNGETLVVEDSPWIDPFAPPLSPENEAFVKSSGKWTRYDQTDREPFSKFIGAEMLAADPLLNESGTIWGCRLLTSAGVILVLVEFDELTVYFST